MLLRAVAGVAVADIMQASVYLAFTWLPTCAVRAKVTYLRETKQ